jgi:drug/metabolite transporter (DMT)-like permease
VARVILLQGELVPKLGPVLPMCVVYATGVLIMATLHLTRTVNLDLPAQRLQLLPGLAASILSIIGFLALTLGIRTGQVAVVVVLSSLTSAITMLMALSLGREPLAKHQLLAVALIVGGLALIRG